MNVATARSTVKAGSAGRSCNWLHDNLWTHSDGITAHPRSPHAAGEEANVLHYFDVSGSDDAALHQRMRGDGGASNGRYYGDFSGRHDTAAFKMEVAGAHGGVISEFGNDVGGQVGSGRGCSVIKLNTAKGSAELGREGHFGALTHELLRVLCFNRDGKLISGVVAEADSSGAGVVQANVGLGVFTKGDGKISWRR